MSQETLEHLVHALRHMYLATASLFHPEVPRIAKIPMYGQIQFRGAASHIPFGASGTVITPEYVERKVKRALEDHVVGVIFDINSPGGEVVPSRRIAQYIHHLPVPTVALVENVAASGGYYIAAACDTIIADECSILGSIGVLFPLLDFKEAAEMFGIKYRGVKAGKHKDMGNPLCEMPEEHREILQEMVDHTHRIFIDDIAHYRNMLVEKVQALATGRIYEGGNSIGLGLVDQLGGLKEAQEYIKTARGLKHARVVDYGEKPFSFPFVPAVAAALGYALGEGIAKNLITEMKNNVSGTDIAQY